MIVSIRKFEEGDIPLKVKWINNAQNNKYLSYDIPISVDGTLAWFNKIKTVNSRFDFVILCDNMPVGLIGLLNIDAKNNIGEYYISMGNDSFKGKGVATKASILLLRFAFSKLKMNKVFLKVETGNNAAIKLYEKLGFSRDGIFRSDIFKNNNYFDKYLYSMLLSEFDHKENNKK